MPLPQSLHSESPCRIESPLDRIQVAGSDYDQTITLTKTAISRFMKSIDVSFRDMKFDPQETVKKRTREQAAQWDLGDISLTAYETALVTACDIAYTAYSHTPIDVQVHIALYTLLATCIDDFTVTNAALGEFMERMYSGSRQLHPLLDRFVENLQEMKQFFAPFASKLIIKSSIDFINDMAVDSELKEMVLQPSALSYVTCKRLYNGVGDAYACFVWDKATFPHISTYLQSVPEGAMFCCYVNDVFSFYKEELAHETANFIHERAIVTGKDVHSALLDVADEAAATVHRARVVLKGDRERQAWESFVVGYIAFHRFSPRYKLNNVFGNQDF